MIKKSIWIVLLGIITAMAGIIYWQQSHTANLVYMVNAKYLPYAMVSIESAVINKKPSTRYDVYIIATDFAKEDIKKAEQMSQTGVTVKVVPAKELKLDYSHLGRFASFAISLQKIFIPEYLPTVNKVLYLDADTLVQKDLLAVYKEDTNGLYGRAVKDGLMFQAPSHMTELKLDWRNFYFNSGVMLLNLDKMRQDGIIRQSLIYFNTHNEVFGDQDILNVVFRDKVKPLPYIYNCNSVFFEENDAEYLSRFYGEKVESTPAEVYKNAAILHFAGYKPWTEWFENKPLKAVWYKYANIVKRKYHTTF